MVDFGAQKLLRISLQNLFDAIATATCGIVDTVTLVAIHNQASRF